MAISFVRKARYDMNDLLEIMRLLRSPDGCPWDREQTHRSLRTNLVEEAYEAVEAIDRDDADGLREELGDVLLQVLFHTDIEQDAGRFTLDDVCDTVCKKLVFRHPFLFGGENPGWDELKKREKGQHTVSETLDAVARSLPACWRAVCSGERRVVPRAGPGGGAAQGMRKIHRPVRRDGTGCAFAGRTA